MTEIEASEALRASQRLQIFGDCPQSYPAHVLVAETIYANFPKTTMKLIGEGKTQRFELYDKENLLLTIDEEGWHYSSSHRGGNWRSIKEGSLESISAMILRPFAEMDYSVFRPEGVFGDALVKGSILSAREKDLTLRQCVNCKERGYMKKVFFGNPTSTMFKPEHSVYGGEKRKRFDPFYKCLNCDHSL
jgi:hypothetical protein